MNSKFLFGLSWFFFLSSIPRVSGQNTNQPTVQPIPFPECGTCDVFRDDAACRGQFGCLWNPQLNLCGNGCRYEDEGRCNRCGNECRWIAGAISTCIVKWDFLFDVCFVVDDSQSITIPEWTAIRTFFIQGVIEALTPTSCNIGAPDAIDKCPAVGIVQFNFDSLIVIPENLAAQSTQYQVVRPTDIDQRGQFSICFANDTILRPLTPGWQTTVQNMQLGVVRTPLDGGGTFTLRGVTRCVDLLMNTARQRKRAVSLLVTMTDGNPNGPLECFGQACSVCGTDKYFEAIFPPLGTLDFTEFPECAPEFMDPLQVTRVSRRNSVKIQEWDIHNMLVLFKFGVDALVTITNVDCLVELVRPLGTVFAVSELALNTFNSDAASRKQLVQDVADISNILCQFETNPPTMSPTLTPTQSPSRSPTKSPTQSPTQSPSQSPTQSPSQSPTKSPTNSPSKSPTQSPTMSPSRSPTKSPTQSPTNSPSGRPTSRPTDGPTQSPTQSPTKSPSTSPSQSPTQSPTSSPTRSPTRSPTKSPTKSPSSSPTDSPTNSPTKSPTKSPTRSPTTSPTKSPSPSPTNSPTNSPTKSPTHSPTASPTKSPSLSPTDSPTNSPTKSPTRSPTGFPTTCRGPPRENKQPKCSSQICQDTLATVRINPTPRVTTDFGAGTTTLCWTYSLTNPRDPCDVSSSPLVGVAFSMDECCDDGAMDFVDGVSVGGESFSRAQCRTVGDNSGTAANAPGCNRATRNCEAAKSADKLCTVINVNDINVGVGTSDNEYCITIAKTGFDLNDDRRLDDPEKAKMCFERGETNPDGRTNICTCEDVEFIPSPKICKKTSHPTTEPTTSPTESPAESPADSPTEFPTQRPTTCQGPPPPNKQRYCSSIECQDFLATVDVNPKPEISTDLSAGTTTLCYTYSLTNPGGPCDVSSSPLVGVAFSMDECCEDEDMDFMEEVSVGGESFSRSECLAVGDNGGVAANEPGCNRATRICEAEQTAGRLCSVINVNDLDVGPGTSDNKYCITIAKTGFDSNDDGELDDTPEKAMMCFERGDADPSEPSNVCTCVVVDFIPSTDICKMTGHPTPEPTNRPTPEPTPKPTPEPTDGGCSVVPPDDPEDPLCEQTCDIDDTEWSVSLVDYTPGDDYTYFEYCVEVDDSDDPACVYSGGDSGICGQSGGGNGNGVSSPGNNGGNSGGSNGGNGGGNEKGRSSGGKNGGFNGNGGGGSGVSQSGQRRGKKYSSVGGSNGGKSSRTGTGGKTVGFELPGGKKKRVGGGGGGSNGNNRSWRSGGNDRRRMGQTWDDGQGQGGSGSGSGANNGGNNGANSGSTGGNGENGGNGGGSGSSELSPFSNPDFLTLRLDECCPLCLTREYHVVDTSGSLRIKNPFLEYGGSSYMRLGSEDGYDYESGYGKQCFRFKVQGYVGLETGKYCVRGGCKCACDVIDVPSSCDLKDVADPSCKSSSSSGSKGSNGSGNGGSKSGSNGGNGGNSSGSGGRKSGSGSGSGSRGGSNGNQRRSGSDGGGWTGGR